MQRIFLLISIIALLFIAILFFHTSRSAVVQQSGCRDIQATPDYLSTENAHDAIAAINNARSLEHISPLNLPANFYQLEPIQQQFLLLNRERVDRHLTPLQMDANLSQLAQGYSQQLLNLHFFSHTSPIAGTFSTRMNSNPIIFDHYSLAAENLAGNPVAGVGPMYEYMYNDSSEACGHRQNILDPDLHFVGIGLVTGSEYGSISAQEFLTSASWNPYRSTTLASSAPRIALQVNMNRQQGILHCEARVTGTVGTVRVSWFLDRVNTPLHIGPTWAVDLRHLSSGNHTLLAYAVDGEQHYGVGRYRI